NSRAGSKRAKRFRARRPARSSASSCARKTRAPGASRSVLRPSHGRNLRFFVSLRRVVNTGGGHAAARRKWTAGEKTSPRVCQEQGSQGCNGTCVRHTERPSHRSCPRAERSARAADSDIRAAESHQLVTGVTRAGVQGHFEKRHADLPSPVWYVESLRWQRLSQSCDPQSHTRVRDAAR